jgi:hypothetical protein
MLVKPFRQRLKPQEKPETEQALEAEAEILKMLQHPIGNRMSQLHFARLASMDASSPQTRITINACSLRTIPFGMLCEVITSLCTDNLQY